MDERLLFELTVSRLPGLSCKDRIRLFEKCGSEAELLGFSKEDMERLLNKQLKYFWNGDVIRSMAERDAKMCLMRNIQAVSWLSHDYPPLLREIYDPPAMLFYLGTLPDPEKPLLALVGTRRPTAKAAVQTLEIAKDLGRQGVSVVSGLALGIDAMAHRGCIEGGAPTYAVLGSAVDEVYPSTNRALARRILENGGALLSEYPPGTGPRKWNFPARNRIISALARGVLITEAPEKSGALITAGFALEQGKDLWVTPPGAASAGTAKLAADGAGLVSCAEDILREWKIVYTVEQARNSEVSHNADTPASLVAALADELKINL